MKRIKLKGRQIPRVLYHWSPRSRLRSIQKHGLRIGRLSVDHEWRAPYLCFSDTPARALMLCPHVEMGTVLDLYEVFPCMDWSIYRLQRPRNSNLIPEWRVFNSIRKRRMFRVAWRKQTKRRLPTL